MSIVKLAISSAPARLNMQKQITEQAGSHAGALYAAGSSRAAAGDAGSVAKGLMTKLKATGVQRANPALNVIEHANVKPLVTGFGKLVKPILRVAK